MDFSRSEIANASSSVARNFGQEAGSLVKSASNEAQSGLSAASQAASHQVVSSIDAVKEGATRKSDAVSSGYEPVPALVGDAFDNIRGNLSETFRRQPLALGGAGSGRRCGCGSVHAATDAEHEYLGETSDLVKAKAGEVFEEKSQQAVELGTKVMDAVADEAQKQGLTPSRLKSAATELKDKVVRLGDAAQGTRN